MSIWLAVAPIWLAVVVVVWPSPGFYLEGARLYKQGRWTEATVLFRRSAIRNVAASSLMLLSFVVVLLAR